jgi:hypothetical protein
MPEPAPPAQKREDIVYDSVLYEVLENTNSPGHWLDGDGAVTGNHKGEL